MPGAGTWHLAHHQNLASGVCLKRAFKMQFRKAYFTSLVHPSRKLWPKPNSGNSVPCILPCKIGGSWNLMKDPYLSKASFLTIVYQSKIWRCPTNGTTLVKSFITQRSYRNLDSSGSSLVSTSYSCFHVIYPDNITSLDEYLCSFCLQTKNNVK